MDFFRKMYDDSFGSGHYGLDGWINTDLKDNYREHFGFFCYGICWNL